MNQEPTPIADDQMQGQQMSVQGNNAVMQGGLGIAKQAEESANSQVNNQDPLSGLMKKIRDSRVGGVPAWDDPSVLGDGLDIEKIKDEMRVSLVNYLNQVWQASKSAKESNGVDSDLTKCLYMFQGKYEPNEMLELQMKKYPIVYLPLAEHKVHTLESWVGEFFTNGETLISLKPTPVPEMEDDIVKMTVESTMEDVVNEAINTGVMPPPEMIEEYAKLKRPQIEKTLLDEAADRSHRMERVLKDDLIAGGWSQQIMQLISFVCIYGTAGMRCPVIKRDKKHAWVNGKAKVVDRLRRSFEVVSPLDIYPSPGMVDEKGGDLCVRVRYFPQDLAKMRGTANWQDDAINRILQFGYTGISLDASPDDIVNTLLKQQGTLKPDRGLLEGFEFWGQVSGEMLTSFGITTTPGKSKIKDTKEDWYDVHAICISNEVVYCRIMNDGEDRPLSICRCYNNPGSFWGRSPLQILAPLQKICNACARNICINMGFAAGPQSVVDLAVLSPKDDMKMRPLKVWVARSSIAANTAKPIEVFNVPSLANELTNVLEFFQRLADEVTGIPAYANGTDAAAGASRTATGLNMLLGAANRGVKHIVGNFNSATEECVHRLYWWHMEYNPDESLKGDVDIVVQGLNQFVSKTSQATERLNLLSRIAQDPRLSALQSPEELCRMMREIAPGFDLEPDALAPDLQTLRRRIEEQKQAQQQNIEMQRNMAAMQDQTENASQSPIEDRHIDAAATTNPDNGRPSLPSNPEAISSREGMMQGGIR